MMQLHHTGLLLLSYESSDIFYLFFYRIRARASGGISLFHAGPEIQSLIYIIFYQIREHPEFFKRQFLESTASAKTV